MPHGTRTNMSLLGLLVLALALVSCGDGGTGDPTGPDPQPDDGPVSAVEVGESVDEAVVEQILEYVGMSGSIAATGEEGLAMPDSGLSPVLAMNANGEALLGALVVSGGSALLDGPSSAKLLIRLLAPSGVLDPAEAAALDARVEGLAGFQALSDSLLARAARGIPLLSSPENVAQAEALAVALLPEDSAASATSPPSASGSALLESRALFQRFIYLRADKTAPVVPPLTSGGEITLTNLLPVPVELETPEGTLPIGAAHFCAVCLLDGQLTAADTSFIVGSDGAFDVAASIDKDRYIVQAVLDLTGILYARLGRSIDDRNRAAELLLGFLGSQIDALKALVAGKDGWEALSIIGEWATTEAVKEALARTLETLDSRIDVETTKRLLKDLDLIVNKVNGVGNVAYLAASFPVAMTYWNQEPETVTWCVEAGHLYAGCSATIELAPADVTLQANGTVTLFPTVYDDLGRVMPDRAVFWASSDVAVASVPEGPSLTGFVSATETPGSTTITASTETAEGQALVRVEEPQDLLPGTITAGKVHSCGLAEDGSAWCWGQNGLGQLGTGSATGPETCSDSDGSTPACSAAPVQVAGGHTFTRIAAGEFHTCALTAEGAAWCWGSDEQEQLGATAAESCGEFGTPCATAPLRVSGEQLYARIAAGRFHTCALAAADGTAWCWGEGGSGRLGTGDETPRSEPTAVAGAASFVGLSAGGAHSCALAADGAAWCWGDGQDGQLGAGTAALESCTDGFDAWSCSTVPVPVAGGHAFAEVSAGRFHSCAVGAVDGTAWCWGGNGSGELGTGSLDPAAAPVATAGSGSYARISARDYFTCAISADGAAWCWGANYGGKLGAGDVADRATPTPVAGGHVFRQIATGNGHACAIASDGAALCWGSNLLGQLGTGSITGPETCPDTNGPCSTVPAPVTGGIAFRQP